MPGIVTHNIILKDTIRYCAKKEKKTFLLKSIEALFNSPERLSAGLFGAIGPNLFDYIPKKDAENLYGNEISFFMHNGGSEKLIQSMIKKIYSYGDKNNEWAALQRAYLYGFISHIVSDSVFHPFIFYYSGFPGARSKKEIYHYREQNLMFQYNIDNYLQYHDEKTGQYQFNIDEMLAVKKKHHLYRLNGSIKSLLLDSIKDAYPDIYAKLFLLNLKEKLPAYPIAVSYLDLVPYLIRMTYLLKKSGNRHLAGMAAYIRKKNIFFSDLLVQYPRNTRYDKNILNKHRERWENPCGKPGLHYESIFNLLTISGEKTVELWEKIESCLYGKENNKVLDEFKINAYTGDPVLSYKDMKIKRPIRLAM